MADRGPYRKEDANGSGVQPVEETHTGAALVASQDVETLVCGRCGTPREMNAHCATCPLPPAIKIPGGICRHSGRTAENHYGPYCGEASRKVSWAPAGGVTQGPPAPVSRQELALALEGVIAHWTVLCRDEVERHTGHPFSRETPEHVTEVYDRACRRGPHTVHRAAPDQQAGASPVGPSSIVGNDDESAETVGKAGDPRE
jgi:hypothetical protein